MAACSPPPSSWVSLNITSLPPSLSFSITFFKISCPIDLCGNHVTNLFACFLIYCSLCVYCKAVEVLENLAFLANASNLVTYLTEFMHFSLSRAASEVSAFMGTAFLLALLGGFFSDAFLSTFIVFIISAFIEFMVLTLHNFFLFFINIHYN